MVEVNESQKALVGQLVIRSLEKDMALSKIEQPTTKKSPIVSRILENVYSVPESESEDKEFLYTPNLIVVITNLFSGVGGLMHLSACLTYRQ